MLNYDRNSNGIQSESTEESFNHENDTSYPEIDMNGINQHMELELDAHQHIDSRLEREASPINENNNKIIELAEVLPIPEQISLTVRERIFQSFSNSDEIMKSKEINSKNNKETDLFSRPDIITTFAKTKSNQTKATLPIGSQNMNPEKRYNRKKYTSARKSSSNSNLKRKMAAKYYLGSNEYKNAKKIKLTHTTESSTMNSNSTQKTSKRSSTRSGSIKKAEIIEKKINVTNKTNETNDHIQSIKSDIQSIIIETNSHLPQEDQELLGDHIFKILQDSGTYLANIKLSRKFTQSITNGNSINAKSTSEKRSNKISSKNYEEDFSFAVPSTSSEFSRHKKNESTPIKWKNINKKECSKFFL